jgi:hypothetical protein
MYHHNSLDQSIWREKPNTIGSSVKELFYERHFIRIPIGKSSSSNNLLIVFTTQL